jgi:hypothetical protein
LKRVPALLQDSREMTVRNEGRPDLVALIGAAAWGIFSVEQNPRIADVKIRDASKASLSCTSKRDRNWTKGLIMKEFHKNESSKLSISNVSESTGLRECQFLFEYLQPLERHQCMIIKWEMANQPILETICKIEICAEIETAIAKEFLQFVIWVFHLSFPAIELLTVCRRVGIFIVPRVRSENMVVLGTVEAVEVDVGDPFHSLSRPNRGDSRSLGDDRYEYILIDRDEAQGSKYWLRSQGSEVSQKFI